MEYLLLAAVGLLSFANGANDNFKGVATLWGSGQSSYRRALTLATMFTFLGSLAAARLATGLVSKFNGSTLVGQEIYTQAPFLASVALGAAATVLLASWLGLPVSTTHAVTGSLAGAGVLAAGAGKVNFAALSGGVVLPLLLSPVLSLGLTFFFLPVVRKLARGRDCLCVEEAQVMAPATAEGPAAESVLAPPEIRWASASECQAGTELARGSVSGTLHWLSGAGISFARGLNDTPKIAALLLVVPASASGLAGANGSYALVAAAMALGGMLSAGRVAQTMSRQITPMAAEEAVSANLVTAALVALASLAALPVSTTHVTSGGIFGIGLRRRNEADWKRVREIALAWAGTLPLGIVAAAAFYLLLRH
ncbi:MAG: inorganic phosphate transporter [Acidobacteria bacterium]|nr:inorganic phosphate transporter [Acidobacteriota bacterium]